MRESTVVREAIKWLAARGLVSLKAGQGAVVGGDLMIPAAAALLLAFHRRRCGPRTCSAHGSCWSRISPPSRR
jgi:hypothetical protein